MNGLIILALGYSIQAAPIEYTDYYVSNDPSVKNDECDADNKKCIVQRVEIKSQGDINVDPSNVPCWKQLVHGFEDQDAGPASHAGKDIKGIKDPYECMLACQKDDTCAYFQFAAPPSSKDKTCLLKTKEMMKRARDMDVYDMSDEDVKWCNNLVFNLCTNERYACQTCNGHTACIYTSRHIVSGPAYCINGNDSCDGGGEMTTSTTTTTTTGSDTSETSESTATDSTNSDTTTPGDTTSADTTSSDTTKKAKPSTIDTNGAIAGAVVGGVAIIISVSKDPRMIPRFFGHRSKTTEAGDVIDAAPNVMSEREFDCYQDVEEDRFL